MFLIIRRAYQEVEEPNSNGVKIEAELIGIVESSNLLFSRENNEFSENDVSKDFSDNNNAVVGNNMLFSLINKLVDDAQSYDEFSNEFESIGNDKPRRSLTETKSKLLFKKLKLIN